jgi:hypothetical protein
MSIDVWPLIRQLAIAAPHEALADLLIATLKSTQPTPETAAQPPPDPDPKRVRRSSNRRSRRPSSLRRKPKGNGHSNVEGAQSLASRFWAKAEELSNTPWKLVADRLHAKTWRSARMRIACANCLHPSCPRAESFAA